MPQDDERDRPLDEALDPRYIALQRVVGRLTTLVCGAVLLVVMAIVFLAADDMPRWLRFALPLVWLTLLLVLTWHAERWPALSYRHTSYRADDEGIEIRRGVYWRSVTSVPRSRVQHTDVSQGPLERRYGLGTLVIYTAGTDHARVGFPGLEYGAALRLRDLLRPGNGTDAV